MKLKRLWLPLAAVVAVSSAAVLPVAADAVSDAIKWRQSAYTYLGWNTGRIKQELDRGASDFNRDRIVQAANAIAAVSASGLGELYVPGSDQGSGWKTTRLKSEFFANTPEVVKVAQEFARAAKDLADNAPSASHGELSTKFAALGESCRGCHSQFRIPEE